MLSEHIDDSIITLAQWDVSQLGLYAPIYYQLENITRACCAAADTDFDARLGAVLQKQTAAVAAVECDVVLDPTR